MFFNEDNLYLWLSFAGFSSQKLNNVLSKFTVIELFDRVDKDNELDNFIGNEAVKRLKNAKSQSFLSKTIDEMHKNNISFISIADKRYPKLLNQENVLPPCGLYCKGDISLFETTGIAMVGTRHCSEYGMQAAEKFAKELCEYGMTVVSGMATGIDAFSHAAALKADGKTIAVLGSGLLNPTPVSNTNLFKSIIAKGGLVVSEYPPDADAFKYTFPERNRIISGISEAVIVVEASKRSGALITADRALEQGREIFAVPGNITSSKSDGTNNLIKLGAKPLTSISDILEHFNTQNTKINKNRSTFTLDIFEQKVYNLLQNGELSVNELAEQSEFSIAEVLKICMSLNLKQLIYWKHNNIIELRRIDN